MPDDDGHDIDPLQRVWSWLQRRAPHLAVIVAFVLASGTVLDWVFTGADNISKLMGILGIQSDHPDDLKKVVLKGQYPLEPLSAYFDVEFSMNDPMLGQYAQRVQAGIVTWLKKARDGRGPTADDLHDEKVLFSISVLTKSNPELLPEDNEGLVQQALFEDMTTLIFSEVNETKETEAASSTIRFMSMPPPMQDQIKTLPSAGKVSQSLELFADFQRHVFIKHVRCIDMPRLPFNSTALSALDLVGRRLTWESVTYSGDPNTKIVGVLTKIAVIFPFDQQDDDSDQKYISMNGNNSVLLTSTNLGLSQIVGK